jgi:hypothetical protein
MEQLTSSKFVSKADCLVGFAASTNHALIVLGDPDWSIRRLHSLLSNYTCAIALCAYSFWRALLLDP